MASHPPAWLAGPVHTIEERRELDPAVRSVRRLAEPLVRGKARELLGGAWLGHVAHPLLTDVPIGCFLSATLLDLLGGAAGRPAAQRLVAIGVLATVPTALTGLSDWGTLDDDRTRRVGVVHAALNTGVALSELASWRARRRGHHAAGVGLALVGGGLAMASGYLGGHLSFARGSEVTDDSFEREVRALTDLPAD